MSDIEESEGSSMPPKAMNQDAVRQLVTQMLEEMKTQEKGKEKEGSTKKDKMKMKTEWGDETDEEEEEVEEEKEVLAPDQKVMRDAFKSISRDNLDGIPTYGGNLNGEELLEWIDALGNHFDYKEVAEEKRVNVAKSRLKGSALVWWNMMQEERLQEGKKKIVSWERMKIRLKAQFLPKDYEVQLHKKLQNLKQRELDVSSYTEEFHKLSLRAKKHENEVEKLARYMNGLRTNIQDEISILTPDSVHKCFQLALRAEEKFKRRHEQQQKQRGGRSFRGRGTFGRGPNAAKIEENSPLEGHGDSSRGSFRGTYRGRSNFRGRWGQGGRNTPVFTGRCYHCNQVGHSISRCPERASGSHVGERRTHLVQEEDTTSTMTAIGKAGPTTDGENLMVKRTLLKMPQRKEPRQRKSLFRTTCKSHGKICKVIVDSGSTENIVSLEMVEKLKLKRLPHHNPYKVSWLNKGQHVLVDEQAWVEFEIGEYKDRVLCDILPMDACHLLLGRPWQHDVKSTHDGEKNSYIIVKDGKKYQMDPLPDQHEEKQVGSSVMMLSGKEFLQIFKHEGEQGYAIILKPKEEAKPDFMKDIPQDAQELLKQYEEVIGDDKPDSLPPMRDINHQIDLIPGSNLPNKAAYKMTPSQNEEIGKQVQEMMDKGFIRKSLSPCAIPTVLVPNKGGKWRMCIDSRAINKITIRYRFPMPRIEDLLDNLGGACYFTKLDLKSG